MGRDYSRPCHLCGLYYGGFDGPDACPCKSVARLDTLAHNLAIGAALCRAHTLGVKSSEHRGCGPDDDGNECEWEWRPGCGRQAP